MPLEAVSIQFVSGLLNGGFCYVWQSVENHMCGILTSLLCIKIVYWTQDKKSLNDRHKTSNLRFGSLVLKAPLHISASCSSSYSVFLSGVVPLAEMAGFTPFLLQLLALRLSTCLVSGHPPSNQSFLSPPPLAFSRSSLAILAFIFPLTSRSRVTLKALSSSLLSTCPYHLTPFAVTNQCIVSLNLNMSICSSVVFLSTTF